MASPRAAGPRATLHLRHFGDAIDALPAPAGQRTPSALRLCAARTFLAGELKLAPRRDIVDLESLHAFGDLGASAGNVPRSNY